MFLFETDPDDGIMMELKLLSFFSVTMNIGSKYWLFF